MKYAIIKKISEKYKDYYDNYLIQEFNTERELTRYLERNPESTEDARIIKFDELRVEQKFTVEIK